jgi:hypothetical protein
MGRFTVPGFPVLAFLVAFLASGVSARGQVLCQTEAEDIAALRTFERAVASYVEVHRRLDAGFMSLWIPSDPEANAVASSRLADAIRFERQDALVTAWGLAVLSSHGFASMARRPKVVDT